MNKVDIDRYENHLKELKTDYDLSQSHVEQLQGENKQLNDDVQRLRKLADGLEILNKQFTDLEH